VSLDAAIFSGFQHWVGKDARKAGHKTGQYWKKHWLLTWDPMVLRTDGDSAHNPFIAARLHDKMLAVVAAAAPSILRRWYVVVGLQRAACTYSFKSKLLRIES
jgi:hypothetical protein